MFQEKRERENKIEKYMPLLLVPNFPIDVKYVEDIQIF